MIRTLHADAYVTVTLDEHTNVVRYTRSATTYPTIEVLRGSLEKIRGAFAKLPNGKLSLLIDVRIAPPRNDAAFEAEILEALRLLAAQFPLRATLVQTAVGKLQTQRLARTRDDDVQVFSNEAEALAHLTRR